MKMAQARLFAAVMGICLIGVGSWMVYPPLGLIVPGALLLVSALVGELKG